MSSYLYGDYVKRLANLFEAKLLSIEATYGFQYGEEYEVVLCEALRSALPMRYGVCRGFVIDRDGRQAGDDVVIYDQHRFPTLRLRHRDDFSRKEQIPVEAVYAYIEAKHTLVIEGGDSNASLRKASLQAKAVKDLLSTRDKMSFGQQDPYFSRTSEDAESGALSVPKWLPKYRNPPFCMIFARQIANKTNKNILDDPQHINSLLKATSEITKDNFNADVVVAGKSNIMAASFGTDIEQLLPSLFYLPEGPPSLSCYILPDIAVGAGLIHLMAALDWINLGRINWEAVMNDSRRRT